jgi:hypothetical protein
MQMTSSSPNSIAKNLVKQPISSSVQQTTCNDGKSKCTVTYGPGGTVTGVSGDKVEITNVDTSAHTGTVIEGGKDLASSEAKLADSTRKLESALKNLKETATRFDSPAFTDFQAKFTEEERLVFTDLSCKNIDDARNLIAKFQTKDSAGAFLIDKLLKTPNQGNNKVLAFQNNLQTNYKELTNAMDNCDEALRKKESASSNLYEQRKSSDNLVDKVLGWLSGLKDNIMGGNAQPNLGGV